MCYFSNLKHILVYKYDMENFMGTFRLKFPLMLEGGKDFHGHVDASSMALGAVLAQPREGEIDHAIAFNNYNV